MRSFVGAAVLVLIAFAIFRAVQSSKAENTELGTLQALPPSIQQVVSKMDPETRNVFFREYAQKRKPLYVGYILWFVLSLYYAYYRKVGLQFVFWITGGGFLIWWIIDLFRMPSIARQANEQIARQVLQTLQIGQAFDPPTPA